MDYVSIDDQNIEKDSVTRIAEDRFGIRYLYPYQRLVIDKILQKKSEEDFYKNHIILLPTGSGKTLCFMIPALLLEGVTLVIYPLISLINDQKRRLDENGIDYVVFTGGQTTPERTECFNKLKKGCRIILANPEILQVKSVLDKISECNITHVVVDEAHCISEWGKSFRPSYLKLKQIIALINPHIISAFTATAGEYILNDIQSLLFNNDADIIQSPQDRPNIHYSVRYSYSKRIALLKTLRVCKKPCIVFCSRRKDTEDLARLTAELYGRELVYFYHAGLERSEKLDVEKWFYKSEDGILFATCAYGMGVSKDNIRTVIHYTFSSNLESFCQEAGRAGRDGDDADSIVLWSFNDTKRFTSSSDFRLKKCSDYIFTRECRRRFILDYFGDENQCICSGCDICNGKKKGLKISYSAADGEKVYNFIKKRRSSYTQDHIINELTDYFNYVDNDFPFKIWENTDIKKIITQLIDEGRVKAKHFLKETYLDVKI